MKDLHVSQRCMDAIKAAGMEAPGVSVCDFLPYPQPAKDRPPISRDRFCEYDAGDMEWAEPLGLAKWQTDEVHAIEVNLPSFMKIKQPFEEPFMFRTQFKFPESPSIKFWPTA